MLSHEDNELLTRVGPGTPMGRFMREYWIPALLSSELPGPDCDPVRVMLLCERLVAFRDSTGAVGLLAEACPHRCASLFFGRNEERGLRCAYHGWKFDVTGACVDMPTEPADSTFKHKVRATAYPCVERGGIVWTYMGPRATPPPLPAIDANEEGCRVDATLIENNWLQTIEGDIDLAHVPYLHADNLEAFREVHGARATQRKPPPKRAIPPPHIEVADTAAGFAFAAPTPRSHGRTLWNVGHFLFPFYSNLPFGQLGRHWLVARSPMDDHHTMSFGMWCRGTVEAPLDLMVGPAPHYEPNTSDWFGRFRPARNASNDYGMDRERARTAGAGFGVAGQATQDAAITWSMGPIVDRAREHLGRADVAIIHLRKRLLAAVRDLDTSGAPASESPGAYRIMHGAMESPDTTPWHEELARRGGAGEE